MKPRKNSAYTWPVLAAAILISLPAFSQDSPGEDQANQGSPFSQASFVPDISLILDCSYLHRDKSDAAFSGLHLPGAWESPEHEHGHGTEGFNLNYAEISFYSVVDPYFDLFAVLHASPEHVHIEEAYWLTRKFPAGMQIKAGKFLSHFGRINEMHTHYWDFGDRPLIHSAIFGDEGLNEIGARVTWVAPTETYLLFGGEVLMGENGAAFGRTGFGLPGGGFGTDPVRGPSLAVGYIKSSVDIGEAAVLAGVSGAYGNARSDGGFSSADASGEAFSGHTTVVGCDLTVKYLLDPIRYLTFQSEYLWRNTDGTSYTRDDLTSWSEAAAEKRQSGFYAQAVGKFGLRTRAAVRFDLLNRNEAVAAGVGARLPERLPRYSAMLEYNPTEFSRIRLQFNHDRSRARHEDGGCSITPFNEVTLQVNLAIGAHGAHSF